MKSTLLLFVFLLLYNPIKAQEFQSPESAAYDPLSKRYFISNYGDGNIIQIDSAGKKSYFKKGLSRSLGMIIKDNTLYVVTNFKMVKGFNLSDTTETFTIQIEEAVFLNDITADEAGFLYVTDSNDKAVYKIDISRQTYALLVRPEQGGPNGIIFDKANNRLIICHFREKAGIDAIPLDDLELSPILKTDINNLDGITLDEQGNFYMSSWEAGSFSEGYPREGKIYKFDNQFKNKPVVVIDGLHGPADIYFNKAKQELVIPLFLDNEVRFESLKLDGSIQ